MIAFWIFAIIVFVFGFVVFTGAPYVPSQKRFLRQAFEQLYLLSDKDTLVDIGSGDGVVLRVAASYGAKAVGYEINPVLVAITKFLSRGNSLVEAHVADVWRQHLPDSTTVIYVFGVTRDMKKFDTFFQGEANRLERSLSVIGHGATFPHRSPEAQLNAHALYIFHPLQPDEA